MGRVREVRSMVIFMGGHRQLAYCLFICVRVRFQIQFLGFAQILFYLLSFYGKTYRVVVNVNRFLMCFVRATGSFSGL